MAAERPGSTRIVDPLDIEGSCSPEPLDVAENFFLIDQPPKSDLYRGFDGVGPRRAPSSLEQVVINLDEPFRHGSIIYESLM